ncbi:uncharacterized protein E0L32_005644 [Thyridium curvatum]|uniref:Uncharacterized protein n=1 Tax=Thyridium curvatum TaxID=1093900 RepID=A0A507B5G3_9PEZI|nr:uncharacterized protein E0L32_005644 [Thyridium curvatum]TPX13944.1 hypothetical protein E0L32_005644 [Thyridium curvatum]
MKATRALRAAGRLHTAAAPTARPRSSTGLLRRPALMRGSQTKSARSSLSRPGIGAWAQTAAAGLPSRSTAGARQPYSTDKLMGHDECLVSSEAPGFAFVFDIDGVLLHVAKPIPGASETLRYLHEHNIPFILLTNGGGKPEAERVRDLGERLGVHLTTANFVQSHTPFQDLVAGPEGLGDKTILVTGSDPERTRRIAEGYGFKMVVTPADILAAQPAIWPFDPLLESAYAATARPLPKPLWEPGMADGDALRLDAMFVFNDPRDWALDIQIIVDALASRGGLLGTYSARNGRADLGPGEGWQSDGQPALYFSNADLLWSAGYHLPRFGQGAFQAAVAGVWERLTGGVALRRTVIGKPYAETYRYAERVLAEYRREVLERTAGTTVGAANGAGEELRAVYMIGDNPESDIRGANEYESEAGTEWCSVLVRTGVWSPERGGGGRMAYRPTSIADDVRAAVRWALKREGWEGPPL